MLLAPPIAIYPATNVGEKYVTTKFWQIFILSHPHSLHCNGGGHKPCTTKLLLYLVRNNMEPYPCPWISFVNQKNEKNEKLKFVNENYIYCSEAINFQSNWSVDCIPILWTCRQTKHHQLGIRSEIFISLETILNTFNVW